MQQPLEVPWRPLEQLGNEFIEFSQRTPRGLQTLPRSNMVTTSRESKSIRCRGNSSAEFGESDEMVRQQATDEDLIRTRKARARKVIRRLKKEFPEAECALHHESEFQLLVATILSAQCTDVRVNMATPELFRRFPDAASLARASQAAVEKIVKPLGFFRNKAANIRAMAQALVNHHQGQVPQEMDDLVQLPGVGRKTASVVLGTWFGIPSGVVVDTHVKRICNLLGLTESKNPDIIERDLMEILPKKEWIEFSHRIILHGRRTCIARRPQCQACVLLKTCPRVGLPEIE